MLLQVHKNLTLIVLSVIKVMVRNFYHPLLELRVIGTTLMARASIMYHKYQPVQEQ